MAIREGPVPHLTLVSEDQLAENGGAYQLRLGPPEPIHINNLLGGGGAGSLPGNGADPGDILVWDGSAWKPRPAAYMQLSNEEITHKHLNHQASPGTLYYDLDYGDVYLGQPDGSLYILSEGEPPPVPQMMPWVDFRFDSNLAIQATNGVNVAHDRRKGIQATGQTYSWGRAIRFDDFIFSRTSAQSVYFSIYMEEASGNHLLGIADSRVDINQLDNNAYHRGIASFYIYNPMRLVFYGNNNPPPGFGSNWNQNFSGNNIPTGGRQLVLKLSPQMGAGLRELSLNEVAVDNWDRVINPIFSTTNTTNTNASSSIVPWWITYGPSLGWWLSGIKVE